MAAESTASRIRRLIGPDQQAAVRLKLSEKTDASAAMLLDGDDDDTRTVLLGLLDGAGSASAPDHITSTALTMAHA